MRNRISRKRSLIRVITIIIIIKVIREVLLNI